MRGSGLLVPLLFLTPFAAADPPRGEVQKISVVAPLAGTFKLTFNGQTTSSLSATATPAQVETALNALSSIGGVGGVVGVGSSGADFLVTFGGTLIGVDVAQITATGQGGAVVNTSTPTPGGPPSEVQRVTIGGSSGTFTLTFNGQTTGALGVNATAAQVQTELDTLSTLADSGGSVAVTKSGNVYTITFGGSVTGINVSPMTALGSGGATPTLATLNDGGLIREQQTVTVAGASGTFTLTFKGQTTGPLAFNATAAQVRSALNALPTIAFGGGFVTVVGSGTFQVTFGGALAGVNQPQMTASGSGGAVATTGAQTEGGSTNEIQRVAVGGSSGTFTLTFNGQTTSPLAFDAIAASVQAELSALPTIGGAGATTTTTRSSNVYTITFGGSFAASNLPQMTASPAGGATANTDTAQDGVAPVTEVQKITVVTVPVGLTRFEAD